MSGIKRTPADEAFSKCVRERANYCCERCGRQYDASSTGLHCSHHFSRRHRTIRWCGDNAMALCYTCHEWFGGNPADSGVWLRTILGDGMLDILRGKMNARVKVSKDEEKEIAAHYRSELKLMRAERKAGIVGRVEFVSWQ
ncbi:MAG: recombination protein NinG [Cardiobacteriaceae bacterium]|nr:recombination protein NinG [Cardiobacteriaceae bacterium]